MDTLLFLYTYITANEYMYKQQYPHGTDEKYSRFSSRITVAQDGKKPKDNQRRGGGAGQRSQSDLNLGSPKVILREPGFPAIKNKTKPKHKNRRRKSSSRKTMKRKRGGAVKFMYEATEPTIPFLGLDPNRPGALTPNNNLIISTLTFGNPISANLVENDRVLVLQKDGTNKIGIITTVNSPQGNSPPTYDIKYDETGNVDQGIVQSRIDVISKSHIYEEFIKSLIYDNIVLENKLDAVVSNSPIMSFTEKGQEAAKKKKDKKEPKRRKFMFALDATAPPHEKN